MSTLLLCLLAFGGLAILILAHVPISISLLIVGIAGLWITSGFGPAVTVLSTEFSVAVSNVDLAAIPLFLLMGSLASANGLSADIYRLAHVTLGHKRGGLAIATIVGCAGFGSLCGSSIATAATMGQVALPEMLKRGYSPGLSTGAIAAGGTLGSLVPPTVIMVIYAYLTEQFVITMYFAALLPAAIAVTMQWIAVWVTVLLRPEQAPVGPRVPWGERWGAVFQSSGSLAIIFAIVGSLYSGLLTTIEAACAGVVLCGLMLVVRKRAQWPALRKAIRETGSATAMIYFIIIGASVFTYFLGAARVPQGFSEWVGGLGWHPLLIIFVLLLFYVVAGSVFETVSAMVITLPFVAPIIVQMDYSLVWWGVIMVMVIEIGLITPPIGMNVFVVHALARDIRLKTIFVGVVPFLISDFTRLILLVLVPSLVLWIPELVGSK